MSADVADFTDYGERPKRIFADAWTSRPDDSSGPTAGKLPQLDHAGYDGFNRRIARTLDEGSDGSIEDREFYYYDGQDVALVLSGNLAVRRRYLHGAAVDQVLAEEVWDAQTGEIEDVYWLLADHQGSIRDVAAYDGADGNGAPQTRHVEHVEFDSFGRIVEVSRAGQVDPSARPTSAYAYTGREWDADVALQYNRNRWYDANLGRWMSQDPIGFSAGDANLYRYVGNNSTNKIDPNGLADPDIYWHCEDRRQATWTPRHIRAPQQSRSVSGTVESDSRRPSFGERFRTRYGYPWYDPRGLNNWADDLGGGPEYRAALSAYEEWAAGNRQWSHEKVPCLGRLEEAMELTGGVGLGVPCGLPIGMAAMTRVAPTRPASPSSSTLARVHGNSLASPRTAYLYRLEDAEGKLLKWGVTQDMGKRYRQCFLHGKVMAKVGEGRRADMIRMERQLVETQPGPFNLERWAGARFGEQR